MLTIGRKPDSSDPPIAGDLEWIGMPDILPVMDCRRVIHPVHRERLPVVIQRVIDRALKRPLDSGAGSAATGEVVDEDLVVKTKGELRREHGRKAVQIEASAQIRLRLSNPRPAKPVGREKQGGLTQIRSKAGMQSFAQIPVALGYNSHSEPEEQSSACS
jgi:hypothetical protein